MRMHVILIGLLLLLGAGCGGGNAPSSTVTTPTAPTASPGTGAVPVSSLVTIVESSTIEQQGAGQTATSNNYLGQSIRIPGTGSYNNLRFSWDGYTRASPIDPSTRGPVAIGSLYMLAQEYLGLPGDLGSSTPGFLAKSERNEQGQYLFAPSVALKGGTTYWFYMYYPPGSASFSPVTGFSEDTYAGGDMYIAPELNGFPPRAFRKAAASWRVISFGPPIVYYIPPPGTYVDANFKLMGAPAAGS